MLEDYKSALRAGQRAYRARIARGQSPYLAGLDDVLKGVDIVAQEPLLCNDDLRDIFLLCIFMIIVISVDKHYHIGILLNGS